MIDLTLGEAEFLMVMMAGISFLTTLTYNIVRDWLRKKGFLEE